MVLKAYTATETDKVDIFALIDLNCAELQGTITPENFKKVAEYVLADPDYGFFIIARDDDQAVGLMYFSHEWSDWRNGLFFWL